MRKYIIVGLRLLVAAAVIWAGHVQAIATSPVDTPPAQQPADESGPFLWVGRLGDARFAHDGKITSILPLPHGRQILSSSRDGTVRLWDLKTGREVRRFVADTNLGESGAMVLSPDSKHLTARVGHAQLRRWDFKTGKLINQVDITFPGGDDFMITNVAVLACGTKALVGYGWEGKKGHCVLWDILTDKKLQQWTFEENQGIEALCPLPDGREAWIGVGRQAVKLDLVKGKELNRVSFPLRELGKGEYRNQPVKRDYYHGLIRRMVLVNEGRAVLLQRNVGCSLINADDGEILWNSKKRFQLSWGRYGSSGPWVVGIDGLLNIQTQERKRLPDNVDPVCWSPDGKLMYGFHGNRIYGFDSTTYQQMFPTTFGRRMESYVGIDRIHLLKKGKQVLARAGYPDPLLVLWDRKSREYLPREVLAGKWRQTGEDRIVDVHEPTATLIGLTSRKGAFVVKLNQSFEQAVWLLPYKPQYTLGWVRAAADPNEIVGMLSHGDSDWWLWDTAALEKRTNLPAPSYMVGQGRAFMAPTSPTKISAAPDKLRFSADRTTMATAPGDVLGGPRYAEKDTDVIFWAFPTMTRLGGLDVGDLIVDERSRNRIDLAFSRWKSDRIWVWRIPPENSSNAWWEGAKDNVYSNAWREGFKGNVDDGRAGTVVGPRLQLRETSPVATKAVGEEILNNWVAQLASNVYRERAKAGELLESVHDDDIELLNKIDTTDPEGRLRLSMIRKKLARRKADYRLRAAIDLPVTVELLAEHPDGRHVLVYGQGKFPNAEAGKEATWSRGFVWLSINPREDNKNESTPDVLKISAPFALPLVARSMRFAPDGELLIGTAAGTVELFQLRSPVSR